MRRRARRLTLSAAALCLLPALPASAQEPATVGSVLDARYFVSVGVFAPDRKVRLGLDASVENPQPQPVSTVDFSEQFNYGSRDETFAAEFGWNFSARWQFRGQYFRVRDNQRATLDEDVPWGDYVFSEGTSAGAGTDIQITRFFFGRKFWENGRREAGIGIGGHLLDLGAYVNGNAVVDGEDAGFVEERAGVSQPLPNVGAWIRQLYGERWVLQARLDWLSASVGKYDGRIINASAGFEYSASRHFGLGLSWNLFEIDFGIDDSSWQGRARSRFSGPYLALTGYW